MDLRCPLCQSEEVIYVLRTQLIICKLCGWRWIEGDEPQLVVEPFAAPAAPSGNGDAAE